jgi:phage gp36-like protein
MAYATQQDIIDRHSDSALFISADRDNDAVLDTDAIEAALEDASAEMDLYIGKQYELPLQSIPRLLVVLCVSITLYNLASQSPTALTDELRTRYEDAVKLLGKIASGDVTLGIVTDLDGDGIADGPGTADLDSNPREYTRTSMGRLT